MKIYGKHAVQTALDNPKRVKQIWLAESFKNKKDDPIQVLALQQRISIRYLSNKDLDELTSETAHQGVVAEINPYQFSSLDQLLNLARKKQEPPFLLLTDELQDPHNLGAILRTADAAGCHGVIIPKHRAVSLTPGVVKSSAGAIERIPVCQVTNLAQCIRELKEEDIWVFGLDSEGKTSYFQADLTIPIALVVGGEHHGLRPSTRKLCDLLISIPVPSPEISLNASVAAGIGIYEVRRQRLLNKSSQ